MPAPQTPHQQRRHQQSHSKKTVQQVTTPDSPILNPIALAAEPSHIRRSHLQQQQQYSYYPQYLVLSSHTAAPSPPIVYARLPMLVEPPMKMTRYEASQGWQCFCESCRQQAALAQPCTVPPPPPTNIYNYQPSKAPAESTYNSHTASPQQRSSPILQTSPTFSTRTSPCNSAPTTTPSTPTSTHEFQLERVRDLLNAARLLSASSAATENTSTSSVPFSEIQVPQLVSKLLKAQKASPPKLKRKFLEDECDDGVLVPPNSPLL